MTGLCGRGRERRLRRKTGGCVAIDEAGVAGRQSRRRGTVGFRLVVGLDCQRHRSHAQRSELVAEGVIRSGGPANGDGIISDVTRRSSRGGQYGQCGQNGRRFIVDKAGVIGCQCWQRSAIELAAIGGADGDQRPIDMLSEVISGIREGIGIAAIKRGDDVINGRQFGEIQGGRTIDQWLGRAEVLAIDRELHRAGGSATRCAHGRREVDKLSVGRAIHIVRREKCLRADQSGRAVRRSTDIVDDGVGQEIIVTPSAIDQM